MNEVFVQWQAEIAQAQTNTLQHSASTSHMPYNSNLAAPTLPGIYSPPIPMPRVSQQSNMASQALSPQVPQVYAHYAPVPEPTVVEMPGSFPVGAMLDRPMSTVERPVSVNVVRYVITKRRLLGVLILVRNGGNSSRKYSTRRL